MDPLRDRYELDEDMQRRARPLASVAMFGALVLIGALLRRKNLRVGENAVELGAKVNQAAQGLAEKIPFLPKSATDEGEKES